MSVGDDLVQFKSLILQTRRGTRAGRAKPHKLVMLLAVLDLAESGLLNENCIPFDDRLTSRFEHYFHCYEVEGDWCQPGPPYFHLRSSGFWHHKVIHGREQEYQALTTTGGGKGLILQNIDYAYLSDGAYRVIRSPKLRRDLRVFIEQLLDGENRA